MRRSAHILLTSSNHDPGITTLDRLHRQLHRLQTAAADLADHEARHCVRQAGTDHCLTRRILAKASSQYLTKDDFTDAFLLDPGFRQQGLDDLRTKIGSSNFRQGTAELADRCSLCCDNNDIIHASLLWLT